MSQLQLNSPPLLWVAFLARQGAPVREHDGKVAHVVIPRRGLGAHSTLAEELGRDGVTVNAFAPLDVVGRRAAPKGRLIAPLFLRPFVIGRITSESPGRVCIVEAADRASSSESAAAAELETPLLS